MSERWSILIVDDSDDARAEVRRALQRGSEREYDFIEVTTGADALAALNTLNPTCLVLDYQLPDMKAPGLLAAISEASGSLRPAVVVTDAADRRLAREAIRAGAMECLTKGVMNAASLTEAVENAVERHGLLQKRVRALDPISEREVHAKLAMEASGTGLWEWNVGTGAVIWSAECYGIFGLSIEDFDGTAAGFDRLLFPADRERVWQAVRAAVEHRTRYEAEFRIVRPGGDLRWVCNIGRAVYSEHGTARMLGTITDITERKASEAALRDSQQRLAATQAHVPIGIVELTLDGRYVNVNDAFCKIVGFPRDELLGQTFGEITVAEDRLRNRELFEQLTAGAIPSFRFEKRFVRKDGTLAWVDVHGTLIKSDSGLAAHVIGAVVDLTDRKQSEAVLREVDERFRAMADAAPVLIWETDETGVVFVNGHYLDFFGTDFEVICGMGWAQFLHPDDAAGYVAAYQAAFAAREPYSYECRFRRATGEYRWLLNTGRPFGKRGFVGFSADITDSKRIGAALRESEARYRLLFEGSPVPIWEEDFSAVARRFAELRAAGISDFRAYLTANPYEVHRLATLVKIIDVSPAGLRLFGVLSKDALVERMPAYFREETWDVFREELITLANGQTSFQSEAPLKDARGEDRTISLHLAVPPGAEQSLSRVLVTMLDITERKAAEEALLDTARQKDEFVAVLAHELRNPLAPVRTAVALLKARGPVDPVVARCRDVIDRQAAQMARLLDDLLDVSRLSRGRLALARGPVVLQDVIEAAIETARPLVDQRQHELVVEAPRAPVLLDGDAARLTQVLGNLINNAAKFTPLPGRITIAARVEQNEAVVIVADTGIGISANQKDHIFGLFAQGADTNRNASTGLGIGLALARQLVEMHGGSILVSSEGSGQGSEFVVRLPLTPTVSTSSSDHATSPASPALSGLRVLVADDNVDANEMLAAWLASIGCEVRTVTNGATAVHELKRFRPDVALVDLAMPGLDGYEVSRRIRQEPWAANVTLVALTGWGQEEDRRRSIAAGFDHHLVKPADFERLIELLQSIVPGVRK